MPEELERLITQAILAAQARHDDVEKAAVEAAKAYAAGLAAFSAAVSPTTAARSQESQAKTGDMPRQQCRDLKPD